MTLERFGRFSPIVGIYGLIISSQAWMKELLAYCFAQTDIMQANEKELLRKAQENSNWMFSEEEIAVLCNVPQVIVGRVAAASDSPFFLNKCRPEWFVEWMRRHTEFGSAERTPPQGMPKGTPQGSTGTNPWVDAKRSGRGQRER